MPTREHSQRSKPSPSEAVRLRSATLRRGGITLSAAVALSAAAIGVAGCGGAAATAAGGSSGDCEQRSVQLSTSGVPEAAGCRLNTTVVVDSTAFGRGTTVAESVNHAVLQAASTTIANGGRLRIELFGADAYRPVVIYAGQLSGSQSADRLEQLQRAASIRNGVTAVVRAAYDPQAPRGRTLAVALAELRGFGSDVGRALGVAVRDAGSEPGVPSAAVLISDGVNETPDLSLSHDLGRPHLAGELARLIKRGGTRPVSLVAIEGVGLVPGQFIGRGSSIAAQQLVHIWQGACKRLETSSCAITPEL